MALPAAALLPLAVTGITAASGAYTSWRNRKFQEEQNEKDRQHERDMKAQDRQWAVEDWKEVNAYNHPSQQMERLRQAGLNPNLVYGKGADNTATMIRGTQGQASSKPAPKSENWVGPAVQSGLQAYMQGQQIKNMQATADNLSKQNAMIDAETRLKDSQKLLTDASTYKTTRDAAKTDWEISRADELRDLIIQQYKTQNKMAEQTYELNLSNFELQKLKTNTDVKKTFQDIFESQQRVLESRNRIEISETQKLINEQELQKIKIMNAILSLDLGNKPMEQMLQNATATNKIKIDNETIKKLIADTALSDAQKNKVYFDMAKGSYEKALETIEAFKPKVYINKSDNEQK